MVNYAMSLLIQSSKVKGKIPNSSEQLYPFFHLHIMGPSFSFFYPPYLVTFVGGVLRNTEVTEMHLADMRLSRRK